MRGLERHDAADQQAMQSAVKGLGFAVEGIRDDGSEGPLRDDRPLDKFNHDLWLGAEGRIGGALSKPRALA